MEAQKEAGTLSARVTHLEMLAPPSRRLHAPLGFRTAIMQVRSIPLAFYRYLYEQVGRPHHWQLRRDLDDSELSAALHTDACHIDVLYVEGAPAGFFELDLSRRPSEVEILYFGISPDFQGRGLGRFFLSEAIASAWEYGPARVVIHTNTLDSPRALQLYQKAGFSPYAWSEETVTPWR
jgi:GNAT superfamily N-acetyltransferase